MFQQTRMRSIFLCATLAGLVAYAVFGGFFAREIVIEIAILAILAMSLDITAGFGNMVSLCHGAIMGVAAYGFGVLTVQFDFPAVPAALIGLSLSVIFGCLVGWVTGRISGIFFIMATLAFGQMLYTLTFTSRWLGGDDGISGLPRFDMSWLGLNLGSSVTFALCSLTVVALVYLVAAWLMASTFGHTLSAMRSNEGRMKALGVNVIHHRTLAMGFSSLLAAVAGIIAAQHSKFISPDMLLWTVSGEVLVVVIFGGLGTLIGPLLGAVVFVIVKHQVSEVTDYWHLFIGLMLIFIVMSGGRGLYGQLEHWLTLYKGKKHARST